MKLFTSKLRSSADFYTQITLMLIAVILMTVIFGLIPLRADVTEARTFSISSVTKQTLKELDDIVTIKAYFTADLPGYLVTVHNDVQDMLSQYKNYGRGNIRIRFINPNEDAKFAQEAQMLGIPPVQLNVVQRDKYEVVQGFLGIAVLYADKSEVIPVVENTETLEYDLTASIKKVITGATLTIGILQKDGSTIGRDEMTLINNELSRRYSVTQVDISRGEIPENITTLIVPGPKGEFTQQELFAIDQFAMGGKGVLFLIDGVNVEQGLVPQVNTSNMLDLLSHYGVTVNKNVVYDPRYNSQAPFSQGFIQFFVPYGFWPQILNPGFSQESALVNDLEAISLPWASSLTIKTEAGYEALARTSSEARVVSGTIDLSPQGAPSGVGAGNDIVAAQVKGLLTSFFEAPPVSEDSEDVPLQSSSLKPSVDQARIIVVGDADLITDGFIPRFEENVVFLHNLIDGLTLDESLATIRSKAVTQRPIKQLDPTALILVKWGNIIGVPLLVVLFAVVRFAWRRKSQRVGSEV